MRTMRWLLFAAAAAAISLDPALVTMRAQPAQPGRSSRVPQHGQAVPRLLIRNAMVIYGNGKPAYGPVDLLVRDGRIAAIGANLKEEADAIIDATGKYVMPGLVNTHMHWHDERGGVAQPIQYERNLYLAAGVTTARENGGTFDKSKKWQQESAANAIVAPRMIVYWVVNKGDGTAEAIRANVREAKARGADGLKIFGLDRDQLEALLGEARAQGLPTTAHIGVEETTARDFIELGVDSIEHFYGIPDAAFDRVQNFPAEMNYSNEYHRFARAGELWAQADPSKLEATLDSMVEHDVAWSPTLSIYEASRDLIRAKNVPWFREYLHPALERFFEPDPGRHGSYFEDWTSGDEARWSRNYRIWMDALRSFGSKGGVITTGDDAGFIYSLYGFGLIRELELHEEAGFHPLEVIKHATVNGASLLGVGDRLGRVRTGYLADLLVVNGNPLQNLRVLNPYLGERGADGQAGRAGGIEWTIKGGVPYHVQTLMKEVRDIVDQDRRKVQKPAQTTP
jgi:imidazolonepropionase-like amidohydrolase